MQKLNWKLVRCDMGDDDVSHGIEEEDFAFQGSLAEVHHHIEETSGAVDWYSDFAFGTEDGDHYYYLYPVEFGMEVDSVYIKCRDCHESIGLVVKASDLLVYYGNSSKHIQDIFPYLDAGDRELFITGICNDCYNKIFGIEE